jgi:hypothetical protein
VCRLLVSQLDGLGFLRFPVPEGVQSPGFGTGWDDHFAWIWHFETGRGAHAKRAKDVVGDGVVERLAAGILDCEAKKGECEVGIRRRLTRLPGYVVAFEASEELCRGYQLLKKSLAHQDKISVRHAPARVHRRPPGVSHVA